MDSLCVYLYLSIYSSHDSDLAAWLLEQAKQPHQLSLS